MNNDTHGRLLYVPECDTPILRSIKEFVMDSTIMIIKTISRGIYPELFTDLTLTNIESGRKFRITINIEEVLKK